MTKCVDIKQQETHIAIINGCSPIIHCKHSCVRHFYNSIYPEEHLDVFVTIQDQLQMCPYCETDRHWPGLVYQLLLNYSRIHVYLGFIPRPFSVVGNYCFVPPCRCSIFFFVSLLCLIPGCLLFVCFVYASILYLVHCWWVIIVLFLPVVAILLLCCVDSIAVSLFVEFDKY